MSRAIQEMVEPSAAPVAPAGEAVTLESLFRAHRWTVAGWAAHLGGPGTDAEDVVQEVFLTVRAQLDRYVPRGKVTTWLYKVTENTVRQHRRRARVRRWLGGDPRGLAERFLGRAIEPVEAFEQREARVRLYRALDRLPEKHRQVLILFELEELSGEEIADRLDAKLATVWVWLHRARRELLTQLDRLDGGGANR